MAFPFSPGVSGLPDPDDEAFIDLFASCAESRRRLGMPSYTREELVQLFRVKDAPAPRRRRSGNVIPLPETRCDPAPEHRPYDGADRRRAR